MKCDHCGVKRFVCLMYNCTDLNICAFCSSDKLSSPNSKVSISKLSEIADYLSTVHELQHINNTLEKNESHPLLPIHRHSLGH